jgi:hypothetical protein
VIDRPAGPELLRAMARALASDVVPDTSGQAQYSARIVANLCLVLAREAELDPPQPEQALSELQRLLPERPAGVDLSEALIALDTIIQSDPFESGSAIYQALLVDVERRLDVARPEYR